MGLPVAEEGEVRDSPTADAVVAEVEEVEEEDNDENESLEERAQKALSCPCVAELREGPCGSEFSAAFVCFIKSREDEKGSDCVPTFQEMQLCLSKNQKAFSANPQESSEDGKDEDRNEPPRVPKKAIKVPVYLSKGS